jgi:hypothetical protein
MKFTVFLAIVFTLLLSKYNTQTTLKDLNYQLRITKIDDKNVTIEAKGDKGKI